MLTLFRPGFDRVSWHSCKSQSDFEICRTIFESGQVSIFKVVASFNTHMIQIWFKLLLAILLFLFYDWSWDWNVFERLNCVFDRLLINCLAHVNVRLYLRLVGIIFESGDVNAFRNPLLKWWYPSIQMIQIWVN